MTACSIGEVTRRLGVSADTLRYYEKIGLLPRVARNGSGARVDALQALRRELDLLMDSCTGPGNSCPIIDGIEDGLREGAG